MAKIRLENISHTYDGKVFAVKNVNITLPDGSNNALLGPSGCGKTTLMKIIAGLLKPTQGTVFFDGKDVTSLSPQDRDIAMVFQFPVIYDMNVFDNLMFPLLNKKVPKKAAKKKVLKTAEILGLTPVLQARSKNLDMGAKQRVALGRSLVRGPNAFLLDEPLSSIEPEGRWYLKMKIKEIQETMDQTLIYVTHDQSEALTLADKIAIMNKGEFLQYSSRENIYNNPANTFVGYFIGNPGMNFIDCTLKGNSLNCGNFAYDVSKLAIDLDRYGTNFKIGIRPEHVQISRNKKKNWISSNCIAVEHLGNTQILHLVSGENKIKAKVETSDISKGNVWIHFPNDKVKLFKQTGELINTAK